MVKIDLSPVEVTDLARLGFKTITVKNWSEIDPVSALTIFVEPGGSSRPATGSDFVALVLGPQVSSAIPIEIRKLFEVARGTLCYGIYFYPLYTLGAEQLCRVLETALRQRCAAADAPAGALKSFSTAREWATSRQIITGTSVGQWQAMVHLRNEASHPRDQTIYNQAMSLELLDAAARMINVLFAPDSFRQATHDP